MASLSEIRARIAAQENKSQNKNTSAQADGATYPHWNMDEGTTASIRFVPDGDSKNEFFWVEKQIIKLLISLHTTGHQKHIAKRIIFHEKSIFGAQVFSCAFT
jgi:hypothetical protein